jgi:alanyl-tRNA synthetase
MIKDRLDLIKEYINFFKSKAHKEIPNSPLIPENDPTVLFTTAGMHPLVPFLLGQKHPLGKRLVNVQKCIRTGDIDEVGNEKNHTFFEMLGNWSLGDYFKKEAIEYSFEFLTKVLKIPLDMLAVSVFEGDKDAGKDEESAKIWEKLGIKKERIAYLPKSNNWWGPAGNTGPCGPDTEMFYWIGKGKPKGNPETNEDYWKEIWNDVLMQYNKDEQGNFNLAKQQNVDTGLGVERVLATLQGFKDNYLTEIWLPIIKEIEKISNKKYGKDEGETRAMRIIADHIKASLMILAEKQTPSNTERGYVLRRLIRRAIRYGKFLGIQGNLTKRVAESIFPIYKDYSHLEKNKLFILKELELEEETFAKTLEEGLKKAEKIFSKKTPIKREKFVKLMEAHGKIDILIKMLDNKDSKKPYSLKEFNISEKEIDQAIVTGEESFLLYQSSGFPLEMIDELADERCLIVPHRYFRQEQAKHQELSRTASAGVFKAGLADNSEIATKYHTATHLLLAALREVLGEHVEQRGSNITAERMRFDFSHDNKLTEQQLKEVEKIVNDNIKAGFLVKREEMSLNEAKKSGATGIFEEKYGEKVSVYTICDAKSNVSKEICSGPHVTNTKDLGKFKILKEEASSKGVRRIKAVLT